jgi:hypothetical protein
MTACERHVFGPAGQCIRCGDLEPESRTAVASPSWLTGKPEDLGKVAREFCDEWGLDNQTVRDDLVRLLEETRDIAIERDSGSWMRERFEDIVFDADALMKFAPENCHPAILGIRCVAANALGGLPTKVRTPDPLPGGEPRFVIEHGVIHDRVTGKHVRSTDIAKPGEDGTEELCQLLNDLNEKSTAAIERELVAAGVDIPAFLAKVHAKIDEVRTTSAQSCGAADFAGPPPTVWTVERCYDYEGCSLEGVFSTKEKAEAYAQGERDTGTIADMTVCEVLVDGRCPEQASPKKEGTDR